MFMLCFTGITQTALALLLLIRPLTVMTAFQLIPECEFPNKHSLTLTLYAPSLFPKTPLSNSRIPILSSAYSRITNSIRNRRLPFCEIEYFKVQIKKLKQHSRILDLGRSSCTMLCTFSRVGSPRGIILSGTARYLIPYSIVIPERIP